MKRYAIRYGDRGYAGDSDEVIGIVFRKGVDEEHALENFYDNDLDGFVAFEIAHVPDDLRELRHRWKWRKVPQDW